MAHRKQVFQSKVLQKLYPAASTLIKEHSPSPVAETQAKKSTGKRKASEQDSVSGDAGKTQNTANLHRRMYTVLPPPPDYSIPSDKSVTVPQFKSINGDESLAGGSVHNNSEEVDEQDEAEEQKKRRRKRRKRKQIPLQDAEKDGAPVSESSTSPSQASVAEGREHISRNKKRKLKKKRHKEKLLSMGLMPRAAALEFMYQKDEDEEDEEENTRRTAELSEFLRTTTGIYMLDSSLHAAKNPHLSAVVDDLLASITSGSMPNSALKQLCCLKTLAQNKEADSLEKALMELNNNQIMSAEETTAVVSLFKYWITDILPLQRDEETRLATT